MSPRTPYGMRAKKIKLRKEGMFTITDPMIRQKYKVNNDIRGKKGCFTHLYPQVKLDLE